MHDIGTFIGAIIAALVTGIAAYGTRQAYIARYQSEAVNDAINHRHERGEGAPRAYDILLDLHIWRGKGDERLDQVGERLTRIENTSERTHRIISQHSHRLASIESHCEHCPSKKDET